LNSIQKNELFIKISGSFAKPFFWLWQYVITNFWEEKGEKGTSYFFTFIKSDKRENF